MRPISALYRTRYRPHERAHQIRRVHPRSRGGGGHAIPITTKGMQHRVAGRHRHADATTALPKFRSADRLDSASWTLVGIQCPNHRPSSPCAQNATVELSIGLNPTVLLSAGASSMAAGGLAVWTHGFWHPMGH